tara:strand:- start:6800 stop:7912 length:1113 start_codon:yes stop_codon:yes gene_type:complete
MSDKCLLILSNPRVCEKILPIIPKLSKTFDITIFKIGEYSDDTPWNGSLDPRAIDMFNYDMYCENVINGPGFRFHGDRFTEDLNDYVDVTDFPLILFDDCKEMSELKMPALYQKAKANGCLVIGNHHGNQEFNQSGIFGHTGMKKSFDKIFVFGEKERQIFSQVFDPKDVLVGGIPGNDSLFDAHMEHNISNHVDSHILVIPNFLGNRSHPFSRAMDEDFVRDTQLEQLSQEYGLPIVTKIKSRLDDPNRERNIEYVMDLIPNGEVVVDSDDIDTLVANSNVVVSALSTLAFKPIQFGKRTIVIEGTGQVGNFYDYNYLVDPAEVNMIEIVNGFEQDREFIKTTLAGGIDFCAKNIYIEELLRTYNESNI